MPDWAAIRSRYLQDDVPVRIGGIAANLARVHSFSKKQGNIAAVDVVIQESKWFIEWTAAEVEIDTAAQLVELQIQLALWHRKLSKLWEDDIDRLQMSNRAREWS